MRANDASRPPDIQGTPGPAVIWFTGLSGAGKSTLAHEVCTRLRAAGAKVECLDGDAIRSLFPNTGFTREERDAHVRRVGFLASRLEHHGVTVVCALISPYESSRQRVRAMCTRFLEVHVATPLEECERRDVKGLYRRARRGELTHFTGVDDAYEPPEHPELRIDTTGLTVAEASDDVMALIAGAREPITGARRARASASPETSAPPAPRGPRCTEPSPPTTAWRPVLP
jgi:adenylylsulfate kinase